MTHDQKTLLLAIWLTNQHSWPYLKLYKEPIPLIRSHIHTLSLRLAETRQAGATWEESIAAVVKLAMGKEHPILAKWAAGRQAVDELAITWRNTFEAWKPEPGDPCYHRKHFEARVAANTKAIWLALEMEKMSANDAADQAQINQNSPEHEFLSDIVSALEFISLRHMIDGWCVKQIGNTDEALDVADKMFLAARNVFINNNKPHNNG